MTNDKLPLMPKATAVWLVDNTSLTFKQIADFCGFHVLEIQGIADGAVAANLIGQNPITSQQLTKEEIARCEYNSDAILQLNKNNTEKYDTKTTKSRRQKYTPIASRGDKPNAIAFLLKYHSKINNSQIRELIGTTNKTIDSIRYKTHWNIKNIKPRDPTILGLCTQSQLNEIVNIVNSNNNNNMQIETGKIAPSFNLPCSGGFDIDLSDLRGKNVVLYFYPKDNTPGCTIEAQDFSKNTDQFNKLDTVILGVSKDSIKSHCSFVEKYDLNFYLISDENKELCSKYGVLKEKSMFGKKYQGIERSTFVIDKKGNIVKIYSNVKVKNHVDNVMSFIKELET